LDTVNVNTNAILKILDNLEEFKDTKVHDLEENASDSVLKMFSSEPSDV
jgi:hypothetical protein